MNYFCTSGGYPVPKQEEIDTKEVWILYGWRKTEMMEALTLIKDCTEDTANRIYNLCGGSLLCREKKERT